VRTSYDLNDKSTSLLILAWTHFSVKAYVYLQHDERDCVIFHLFCVHRNFDKNFPRILASRPRVARYIRRPLEHAADTQPPWSSIRANALNLCYLYIIIYLQLLRKYMNDILWYGNRQ